LDIDEHGPRSDVEHGIGRGNERERWNEDFITGADAERMQDEVKCGRA